MDHLNFSSVSTPVICVDNLSLIQNFNVAFAVLQILFMPGIIFGNSLVIMSILVFKRLRHHTNFMLISLAVADLLVGILACPLNAAAMAEVKTILKDRFGCFFRITTSLLACTASVLSISVIIIDRFIAVCYPGIHFKFSRYRTVVIVLTILWVYTIVSSSLPWMFWNDYNEDMLCIIFKMLPPAYIICVMFSMLGICLFGSLILYAKILWVVRQHHNRVGVYNHGSSMPIDQLRKDIQDTQKIAFMFVIFVLFWAPFFVIIPFGLSDLCPDIVVVIVNGTLVLAFSNSLVNPIVYALTRKNFRIAYSLILTTPFRRYSTLRNCEMIDVVHTTNHRKTTPSSLQGEM